MSDVFAIRRRGNNADKFDNVQKRGKRPLQSIRRSIDIDKQIADGTA